jgi:hypothetical protein
MYGSGQPYVYALLSYFLQLADAWVLYGPVYILHTDYMGIYTPYMTVYLVISLPKNDIYKKHGSGQSYVRVLGDFPAKK